MKQKIILCLGTILFLLLFIACGTKKFPTKFYDTWSGFPEKVIDSISRADSIQVPIDYKNLWNKNMYITSDSVVTTQYIYVTEKKDTTYVISVTIASEDSIGLIKYRKE